MTVPDDLRDALDRNARRAFFETLDSSNRYAVLYRIHDAKKPETRRLASRSSSRCSRSTARFTREWAPSSRPAPNGSEASHARNASS